MALSIQLLCITAKRTSNKRRFKLIETGVFLKVCGVCNVFGPRVCLNQAEIFETVIINTQGAKRMSSKSALIIAGPSRGRSQRRWAEEEISNLLKVASVVRPKDKAGWCEVCMRMHDLGSRRTSYEYRRKFQNYTAKTQRNEIKQNQSVVKQICQLFQEGNSPDKISQLKNVMAVNVQIILNSVFTGIRNVTRKVVGNREEVIQLAFRDYPLFHFVKQNDIRIAPIAKIQEICQLWKGLELRKSELRSSNPERYQKLKKRIEDRVAQFNSALRSANDRFQQSQAEKPSEQVSSKVFLQKPKLPRKGEGVSGLYMKTLHSLSSCFKESEPSILNPHQNEESEFMQHSVSFFDNFLPRTEAVEQQMQEECAGNKQSDFPRNSNLVGGQSLKNRPKQEYNYTEREFYQAFEQFEFGQGELDGADGDSFFNYRYNFSVDRFLQ